MPVTRRNALKRYVVHYVSRARDYHNLPPWSLESSGDLENFLQAGRYCIQIEDWPSLRDLTRSVNQSLKSANWDVFLELNQSLVQAALTTEFLPVEESLAIALDLAHIQEKRGNYDVADRSYG